MLNGFFVLCCFCRMHWEFTPFCNSMNTVATATWFMFFPEGHWWKKGFTHSPISSRIKCRNSHHFPEKSGSHQFTSFAGFSNPRPRQNKKKLANKTIYEDVFKFKTSTLPYKLFRSNHLGQFFQVSQKTFPYQNNKTMAFTHQKSTQQSKQNKTKKANPNKTNFRTKQPKTKHNSDSKQTKFKTQKTTNTQKRSKSNKFQTHRKKKTSNKTTSLFSLWVHISELPGVSPPWWLCITKAHCLSCNFRCLQSIHLWTTRETRCPKTKASVTVGPTVHGGRAETWASK